MADGRSRFNVDHVDGRFGSGRRRSPHLYYLRTDLDVLSRPAHDVLDPARRQLPAFRAARDVSVDDRGRIVSSGDRGGGSLRAGRARTVGVLPAGDRERPQRRPREGSDHAGAGPRPGTDRARAGDLRRAHLRGSRLGGPHRNGARRPRRRHRDPAACDELPVHRLRRSHASQARDHGRSLTAPAGRRHIARAGQRSRRQENRRRRAAAGASQRRNAALLDQHRRAPRQLHRSRRRDG